MNLHKLLQDRVAARGALRLARDVEAGAPLSAADVVLDEASEAVRTRRAMVARFGPS